jgi:hypothetical protein
MLATTGGRLVCLSTAFAKSGFFYEAWMGAEKWERIKVRAAMCPRISKEFLADELAALGPRWFAMEYDCEFGDDIAAVFSTDDIRAAFHPDIEPLFPPPAGRTDPGVAPLF